MQLKEEVPVTAAYEAAVNRLQATTVALVLSEACTAHLREQLAAMTEERNHWRAECADNDDQEEGVGDGPEGGGNAGDGRGGDRPEDVPE